MCVCVCVCVCVCEIWVQRFWNLRHYLGTFQNSKCVSMPPSTITSFRHIVLLQVMPCRAGSSTQDTSFLRLLSLSFGCSREFALLPLHMILATSLVIFTRFSWRGDTKPRVPETGLDAFIHNVEWCWNTRLILRYWLTVSFCLLEVPR